MSTVTMEAFVGARWMLDGGCIGEDPELFYPHKLSHHQIETAKNICNTRCPVMERCRKWARSVPELHGVWGGESEDERQAWIRGTTTTRRRRHAGRQDAKICEYCAQLFIFEVHRNRPRRFCSPQCYTSYVRLDHGSGSGPCGTARGASHHRRRGERPCAACHQRENEASRVRQQRRAARRQAERAP
jgi:WhiB family redox-sensing transcriptional regulator